MSVYTLVAGYLNDPIAAAHQAPRIEEHLASFGAKATVAPDGLGGLRIETDASVLQIRAVEQHYDVIVILSEEFKK